MARPLPRQSGCEPPAVVTLGFCPGCGSMDIEPLESSGCCEDVGPFIRIDYVAMCGRLLVGQGDDTYDPLCVLPAGHGGICKPRGAS